MISSDSRKLQAAVKQAVAETIEKYYEAVDKTAEKTRAETKAARKKGIKRVDDGWTERYAIEVSQHGTIYGKNANISIEGVDRYYVVYQNANRPSRNPKKGVKPQWHIRIHEKNEHGHWEDSWLHELSTEDFDSAVQQCIVALLGHAYYL